MEGEYHGSQGNFSHSVRRCWQWHLRRLLLEDSKEPYVRVAEIEIDPLQLDAYKAAVKEQIEAAVRLQPWGTGPVCGDRQGEPRSHRGLSPKMYADIEAYKAHLETAHFKKYKVTTQDIVKSLKLRETVPIQLGAKSR